MIRKNKIPFLLIIVALFLNGCSFGATPEPTTTPSPTHTPTLTSTATPKPTKTPLPTKTPNLAATQEIEKWYAEIQQYHEKGYIGTNEGKIKKLSNFQEFWAQIDWYTTWLMDEVVEDFVFSAHYRWSSDIATPNISGCGLVFAIQDDGSDFSVFLDKSQILFLRTEYGHGYRVGITRGSTTVKISEPTEADFTIIVYDYYSYILVNGEVVAEYTLPQSKDIRGELGVSILSGTNKGYGTMCEMSDVRLWTPNE